MYPNIRVIIIIIIIIVSVCLCASHDGEVRIACIA